MFPLRDENPSQSVPVMTRVLIVVNVAAFLYEVLLGSGLRPFMYTWGMVPIRITLAMQAGDEPIAGPGLTVLTSMFLHGGWLHLVGNMWYLWIFGDNIEDRLGHFRFLFFYLLAGVVAALLHYALDPTARVPTVGASGAIAGVLGGYLRAFPRARIVTLVPLFPFFQVMALPALVVLGLLVCAIPVDARPFDFYTVSGQKWLCGPDATGGLYVRDPRVRRRPGRGLDELEAENHVRRDSLFGAQRGEQEAALGTEPDPDVPDRHRGLCPELSGRAMRQQGDGDRTAPVVMAVTVEPGE